MLSTLSKKCLTEHVLIHTAYLRDIQMLKRQHKTTVSCKRISRTEAQYQNQPFECFTASITLSEAYTLIPELVFFLHLSDSLSPNKISKAVNKSHIWLNKNRFSFELLLFYWKEHVPPLNKPD